MSQVRGCNYISFWKKRLSPAVGHDKGSATVIMDRKWYLDECYRQLNNPTFYEQQDTDLTDTMQKRVTEYVKRMLNDELIDKKKTNNTYYIRILNPNASIFSLKSMKSIILSLFTDPLFSLQSCAVLGTCDPCRVVSPNHALVDSLCSVRVFKLFSRSIHYIFGDEERVRTPTAR